MISKFADSLLSREDLKRVKGGYGGAVCSCQVDSDCSSMTKCGSKCTNGLCDGNG